jgi:hypothetical protein
LVTKSAKVSLGMMAFAGVMLIFPMLNFAGLIRNENSSQSDPEFVKSIGPEVEIPVPTKPGMKSITFVRGDSGSQVRCLLPASVVVKEDGFAYAYNDAIISVICEGKGVKGQEVVKRFANDKTQPVRTKNGFKGAYEERNIEKTSRQDRIYYLSSPEVSYSMMIAWPRGNAEAKKDAEALASSVAYSIELN